MKTQTINQTVLTNYKKLTTLVKDSGVASDSFWKVSYKKRGIYSNVNGFGEVKRNFTAAAIHSNWIDITRKPFYIGREHALKKINKVLENIINNFDNTNLVKKENISPF